MYKSILTVGDTGESGALQVSNKNELISSDYTGNVSLSTVSGSKSAIDGELIVALTATLHSNFAVVGDLFVIGKNVELDHDSTVGGTTSSKGIFPSITATATLTCRSHNRNPTYI